MKIIRLLPLLVALMFSQVTPGMAQDDAPTDQAGETPEVVQPAAATTAEADVSSDMSSPAQGDAPQNDSAPAATDTQTPVPTDPPVPVDTATPMPIPTDTPTPAPTPPFTSTPTSIAKDVPADTLARQLPFANPGEVVCDLFMDGSDQPQCGPVTFPALVSIQFVNWASQPTSVQVDNRKPDTLSNVTTSTTWDFVSRPGGIGPGTHKITASESVQGQTRNFTLTITVKDAKSPHFLVVPRMVPPGSTARVYLAGFNSNSPQALGIYREKPNCNAFSGSGECYALAHDLGTIVIGGDGTASQSFSIGGNEPRSAYLAVTAGLKISGQDPASALQALGMPWFVVDNP